MIEKSKIREQINKIMDDSLFRKSKRSRSLLQYVCTKTLEGRAEEIKEYSIAVDAFDLDSGFDQQSDPRIRVEAKRLRDRLRQYYNGPGCLDPIIVTIPKGSYVPQFTRMEDTEQQNRSLLPQSELTEVSRIRFRPYHGVTYVIRRYCPVENGSQCPEITMVQAFFINLLHKQIRGDQPSAVKEKKPEECLLIEIDLLGNKTERLLLISVIRMRTETILWSDMAYIPLELFSEPRELEKILISALNDILKTTLDPGGYP